MQTTPPPAREGGNSGQTIFIDDEDRQRWLQQMGESQRKHGLALHAYVLMPNHVHLLATPASSQA
ncbi:MAG: transposase [Burkholderiaceae bacterium]